MNIEISMKGFVKYMTASPSQQRKVIRDFKYPDPEGRAQMLYYAEARSVVVAHHRRGLDSMWLIEQAGRLGELAAANSGATQVRLRNNSRALRDYARSFASRGFELLEDVRLSVRVDSVTISVVPDMHVRERGHERLIRVEFASTPADERVPRILTQLMWEAGREAGIVAKPTDVQVLECSSGGVHRGSSHGVRRAADIEAACRNLEAIWPTL